MQGDFVDFYLFIFLGRSIQASKKKKSMRLRSCLQDDRAHNAIIVLFFFSPFLFSSVLTLPVSSILKSNKHPGVLLL